MGQRGRPRHPEVLTPREQDVLALIREGLTNEQIGARLGISFETAKTHVSAILSKLGGTTREGAVAWREDAGRAGWAGLSALARFLLLGAAAAALIGVAVLALLLVRSGDDESTLLATVQPSPSDHAPTATTSRAAPGNLRDVQQSLVSLQAASFVNEATGWITTGGTNSNLLTTTNAGANWTRLYEFPTAVTDLDFVDEQTGWAATYDGPMQTTDGGQTWSQPAPLITGISGLVLPGDSSLNYAQHIDFVDEKTGWIDATDKVLTTINGGRSWTPIAVPCPADPLKGIVYSGPFSFVDAQTGWMACTPSTAEDNSRPLFKTTDGGVTWQALPNTNFPASDIVFRDKTNGWAGTTGGLFVSSDGGETWKLLAKGTGQDNALPFPATQNHVYTIFGSGALQASVDGGTSWAVVYPPPLPEVAPCSIDSLGANAVWTRSRDPGEGTTTNQYPYTGVVNGVITLTNGGPNGCQLTTEPTEPRLLDSTGSVIVEPLTTPIPGGAAIPFVLAANERATTQVEWSEWCWPSPPSAPLQLVLGIPGIGEVRVAVTDNQGQPVVAPYCHFHSGGPSYLRPGGLWPEDAPANPT